MVLCIGMPAGETAGRGGVLAATSANRIFFTIMGGEHPLESLPIQQADKTVTSQKKY